MFTKKHLKNGDFVELRDGTAYVVVDEMLIGIDDWDRLNLYNDDLKNITCFSKLDIMKVYRGDGLTFNNYNQLSALWKVFDREAEEARVALKKKDEEEALEEALEKICTSIREELKKSDVKDILDNSTTKKTINVSVTIGE